MSTLIFGGTKGIGLAAARQLASLGPVLVAGRTAPTEPDAPPHVVCDVADSASVARAFEAATERLGSIDLVINSAGYGHCLALDEISVAEWDRMSRVTVDGNFYIARHAYHHFLRQGRGHFIIVGSMASGGAWRMEIGYGTLKGSQAKFALHLHDQFTHDRANGRGDFHCHVVCPGSVYTDFWKNIPQREISAEESLTPDEVAETVCALARNPGWGHAELAAALANDHREIAALAPFERWPFVIKVAHRAHP